MPATKPKKIQTRPGFAQGVFGKTMAWILLVYAILGSIGIVMNWFSASNAGEGVGYRVGVVIGVLGLVFGAWRGVMRREKRSWVDWLAGVFLLFIGVMSLPAFVTLLNSVESLDLDMQIALGVTAAQMAVTLLVAIRLLRRPYYPQQETLQAVFE